MRPVTARPPQVYSPTNAWMRTVVLLWQHFSWCITSAELVARIKRHDDQKTKNANNSLFHLRVVTRLECCGSFVAVGIPTSEKVPIDSSCYRFEMPYDYKQLLLSGADIRIAVRESLPLR